VPGSIGNIGKLAIGTGMNAEINEKQLPVQKVHFYRLSIGLAQQFIWFDNYVLQEER
jgi:hypothetical protein